MRPTKKQEAETAAQSSDPRAQICAKCQHGPAPTVGGQCAVCELGHDCPRCHARAGTWCRSSDPQQDYRPELHAERVKLAARVQQLAWSREVKQAGRRQMDLFAGHRDSFVRPSGGGR